MSDSPTWSGTPPDPPVASFSSMSISPVPFHFGNPLTSQSPSASLPQTPPSSSTVPLAAIGTVAGLGPPTPAPSPTPGSRGTRTWSDGPPCIGPPADNGRDSQPSPSNSAFPNEHGFDQPGPSKNRSQAQSDQETTPDDLIQQFKGLSNSSRYAFLASLVGELHLQEALVLSRKVEPRLRRDFLKELPIELALYCLSFIEDPTTLVRASQVSRYWAQLLQDERTWKQLCQRHRFGADLSRIQAPRFRRRKIKSTPNADPSTSEERRPSTDDLFVDSGPSFRQHFKDSYLTEANWLRGGRVLAYHKSQDSGVVTCIAMDDQFLIVGLANGNIHIFDAMTGSYRRSLEGHMNGVWTMTIVTVRSRSGSESLGSDGARHSRMHGDSSSDAEYRPNTTPSPKQSDHCNVVRGWGNRRPLLVTGGCDRYVKVWDLTTGVCLSTLRGHTATVRCVKVLDGRPIAVSGSRDSNLRVWDLEQGVCLGVLRGHTESVRCIEVAGNLLVSGSYDKTCRLWNVDTGECIHLLRGHYHKIYAIAFDGERIVTGSVDSTVRVWDAVTGSCTALLRGHTSLVGQLQLSGDILVSGGSDGRVIVFDLATNTCLHRLCAHDNSVTCLQFDDRFIVSGGNDGRIKLWDLRTGEFIRELSRPGDAVWRAGFRDDRCVVSCSRNGQTVVELLSFKPWSQSPGSWYTRTT